MAGRTPEHDGDLARDVALQPEVDPPLPGSAVALREQVRARRSDPGDAAGPDPVGSRRRVAEDVELATRLVLAIPGDDDDIGSADRRTAPGPRPPVGHGDRLRGTRARRAALD